MALERNPGPESGISSKGQICWSDLAVPGGLGGGFGGFWSAFGGGVIVGTSGIGQY